MSVQLFNGFTPEDTANLVAHSDAKVLYTEKPIFGKMDVEVIPEVMAIIDTKSGELLLLEFVTRLGRCADCSRQTC